MTPAETAATVDVPGSTFTDPHRYRVLRVHITVDQAAAVETVLRAALDRLDPDAGEYRDLLLAYSAVRGTLLLDAPHRAGPPR